GAIPMQYNTALCFVLLALGGCLLQVRPKLWFITGAAGALAAVMGALVIVEYAAGISVGIDTLFLYPWDRTLSADPGRMALTSAISFLASGSSRAVVALKNGWLGQLAILNALSLSLGLTS